MGRRQFLRGMAGFAAAGGAGGSAVEAIGGNGTKGLATDIVKLGPRKVETSRLMMGTGSNGWNGSSNQSRRLGIRGLGDFLRYGNDQGVITWDTADMYGTHPHVREALRQGVRRDNAVILTKTVARSAEGVRKDIDRFRRELGVDTIDILLLHCLTDSNWPERMRGAMDVISEAQERGVIRTKGVSCHSIGALRAAAKEPWVEVDLARINPTGVQMDADPKTVIKVLQEMKAAGKGVIGMKILGAGELAGRMDECIRFAKDLDCVDAFTIGCESVEEFSQVVAAVNAPLTQNG